MFKVEEKLGLGSRKQKRLNTTSLYKLLKDGGAVVRLTRRQYSVSPETISTHTKHQVK
jgi:hypothetical protein